MTLRSSTMLGLALAALAAAAVPAVADPAPWWNSEWAVRRVVDAKTDTPRHIGSEVAVCAFHSGGLTRPDGSDIRVAVAGRKLVNHKVLQVGPGDLVRVAFETLPAETRYFIYYGNPKAEPAAAKWEPRRGVLLEARRWPGGPSDRLVQVQAAWAKAEPLGGDFVSHVSFGFNPFADSDTPAIFHYTGWFVAPQPGTYAVATSSNHRSWLLVDGQEVADARGLIGDARNAKTVSLTGGLHRMDFWVASPGGSIIGLAAWKAPAGDRFQAIPANVFLPVVQATLVDIDMQNEKAVADFFAEHAGEAWWPDRYAVRMRFKNISKGFGVGPSDRLEMGAALATPRFEWDFGDGQSSALASPAHVYLASGDYAVTLKATRGAASHTFRTKVRVERNWWKQTTGNIDSMAVYAEEVSQYLFEKLDTRNLILAVDLFEHANLPKSLVAAATELVLKRPGIDARNMHRFGLLLGESLRKIDKPQDAVTACRQVEDRLKNPVHKAEVAVQIGETLLKDLYRYDEAEKEFQRVLKTYATSGAEAVLRRADIGLGDVYRHRGQTDKARQAYSAAVAVRVVSYSPKEAAVRVGTLARYVEEYTRERQWEWAFKSIDDWEWEFPKDKLDGHWSFLKASALVARGKRDEALLEADDLLAANPASAYAVRLLMLAAECRVAKGETDKARLLLQTAAEDYPEDPQQDAAKKRLKALGGAVKTDTKPKKP